MRKLTLLTLLAAILCLPQMVMAQKYTPTFYFSSTSTLGTLVVGESYDASQDLKNLSEVTPVTWSTSDPTIVSVDENGIITVHQTGSVTLYAHSDESTYFYEANAEKELNITTYPLSILKEGGWVDVTPSAASNIDGEGKVSYDYSTHTLTLNNWTNDFTSITDFSNYIGGAILYFLDNQPLTIRLIGTNTITCGEFCSANTLIFSGADAAQDKLIVNSTNSASISAMNQLTIDNASLVLNETVNTLYQYQNFTNRGVFYADKLSVVNGGNLHATVTGNETAEDCPACLAVGIVSSALVGDITTSNVIWTADAANESRIYSSYQSDTYNGFFLDDQGGARLPRAVEISSNAPVTPPSGPSGSSFTWTTSQINLVDLSCYNSYKNAENGLIKNIFTSLTQTRDKNDDWQDAGYESCEVRSGRIKISNSCGTLKFKSIAGDLTGIVITGSIWTATNLPANWTYNNVAGTLTWIGTPAEEVTITGNLSLDVSSIEYFYDPAAATRVGESFNDYYQYYQITGAHTAKVIGPRDSRGTVSIPESVEDQGVTYYINEIAEGAFQNYYRLSNAFIGENVAVIGAHAFDGCSQITEITIYSHVVESIGDEAFKNCLLLHGFECYNTIPPLLGSNAFEGDTRLNHIDVYDYVVSTYKTATNWSEYATKITALWSARAIGEKFFYSNQKTIGVYEVTSTSPKEVKVLPYPAEVNAIYPITYESSLIIPEKPVYMHSDYKVTGIAANAFKDITDIKVVSIPQYVRSIEAGAFSGCTNVENVFFLWNDPTTVTWADGNVGAEFATAASGNTKIFVPEGKLAAYQAWAPQWAGCMVESAFEDVTATEDPGFHAVFYRTYYDGTHDLLLPPDVWAYVGYVQNNEFILRPIAFDGEIVPAQTAVVLRSSSLTYRLITLAPVAQPYTGTNQLRGSDVNITIATDPELSSKADKIYVLGKEGWVNSQRKEGMGLYRYTGTTLGAHKAYMVLEGVPSDPESSVQNAPARFLFRYEAETTGIDQVPSDVQSTKVLRDGQLIIIRGDKEYNAQGQIVK